VRSTAREALLCDAVGWVRLLHAAVLRTRTLDCEPPLPAQLYAPLLFEESRDMQVPVRLSYGNVVSFRCWTVHA